MMKCDELKATTAQEIVRNEKDCDYMDELFGGVKMPPAQVYFKSDVDAAIDELKFEHHKECHEYIKMVAQLKAENERLKDELDAANNQCENLINSATDIMLRQDKVNDAKCDEIESLKATHYAEMVDAGMRERRLKRALYKSCANWAHFAVAFFSSYATKERWRKMENKCRAKAEKFK